MEGTEWVGKWSSFSMQGKNFKKIIRDMQGIEGNKKDIWTETDMF